MKNPLVRMLAVTLFLPAAIPASSAATVWIGDKMTVSQSLGTTTVTGSYSAAIGHYVTVSGAQSLGVGLSLSVQGSKSLAIGSYNTIPSASSGSFVSGAYNSGASNAVTAGEYNTNTAPGSLVSGHSNIANAQMTNGIVAGVGNAAVTKPALLVLGNGTEFYVPAPYGYRSNAFVVYKDGDIVITKPQGDISMGNYQ